jgi:tetratricopeptide (TPR) repeat protein
MESTVEVYPAFDALWDYQDPAKTEALFREELEKADANHLDTRLQLETQVARTLGLQRKFDEAHAALDQVEAQLTEKTPVARVRYLLERGRALNSSGQRPDSIALFESAWSAASEGNFHGYAVDAAHMMGIVMPGEKSLAWNLKAIAYAEAHAEDEKAIRWLGSLYNNTGWTLHDGGDFAGALSLFQKALALRQENGKRGPILIAQWCIARAKRSLGRFDEAQAEQEALLKAHEADSTESAYVYEELGELALIRGDKETAAGWFAKAHALLSKDPWFVENEAERLGRMLELSQA